MPSDSKIGKHQLSSRLAYSQSTPKFLQKLKNQIAGIPDDPDYDQDEFEDFGDGRVPIPRRPQGEPGRDEPDEVEENADDEETGEERPQVVVLKQGKHLTEREAENIRRKERGLPPLLNESEEPKEEEPKKKKEKEKTSLSFSSSKPGDGTKKAGKKRKILSGEGEEDDAKEGKPKKKVKSSKKLLSFGDEA